MKNSLKVSIYMLIAIWAVFVLDIILVTIDLNNFGIYPRRISGLWGIICSPFLHGGITHIISNSIPLVVLTFVLFYFYPRIAFRVYIFSILLGGLLVWIAGREANHIGASGLIYALTGFLLASGIFRKQFKALIIAVGIFIMYGGIIWGVLPTQPWVSWEGHLFGFLSGIFLAWNYRKSVEIVKYQEN